jgi:predicted transcriptional regulator
MAGERRVRAGEYAGRVNAAADLAAAGVPAAEAGRVLAGRFGCSVRQARRYVERAAGGGRVPAPEATAVFTVKLPTGLAGRVREHARLSGRTISAVVAQALEEFLARGRRNHPRR